MVPTLLPEERDRVILCTAPSKTFNLAGLQLANTFISHPGLRKAFKDEISKSGYDQPSAPGIVACRAAYEHGAAWLDALNAYLWENMLFIDRTLKTRMPKVKLIPPQATYLAWLDCRDLKLSNDELDRVLLNQAKLWFSRGDTFGASGSGFVRINVACPRALLETAMEGFVSVIARG
jgi:cystathionine beta-lyase